MDIQALVPQRSVEGFDEGVIGRLARSREIDPRSMVISPQVDKLAGKLCTIVSEQIFWCASQSNEPVENLDDVLASEPVSNFDCQSFTCEDIDNRQRPELLTIAELIMDEVEAPSC